MNSVTTQSSLFVTRYGSRKLTMFGNHPPYSELRFIQSGRGHYHTPSVLLSGLLHPDKDIKHEFIRCRRNMQLGRRRSLLRLENFDERRIGKDSCRSHGVLGRLEGRSWGLGGQTWWMSLLLLPLQIALIPLATLVPLGSLVAGVKNPESPGDTVANR
jgi:hypothetical protein